MPLNPRLVLLLSLLAACADEKPAEDVAPTASITDPASGATVPAEETWTLRGMATDTAEPVSQLRARWLVDDVVVCDSAAPAADSRCARITRGAPGCTHATITPSAPSLTAAGCCWSRPGPGTAAPPYVHRFAPAASKRCANSRGA